MPDCPARIKLALRRRKSPDASCSIHTVEGLAVEDPVELMEELALGELGGSDTSISGAFSALAGKLSDEQVQLSSRTCFPGYSPHSYSEYSLVIGL